MAFGMKNKSFLKITKGLSFEKLEKYSEHNLFAHFHYNSFLLIFVLKLLNVLKPFYLFT